MITVKHEDQRVQDLLCNALEGGSNYWYQIRAYNFPEGATKASLGIEFTHLELPFKEGGSITIGALGHEMPDKVLDRKSLRRGLALMANNHPNHYADFLKENDDATTGDVFLQCCLYGKAEYKYHDFKKIKV